MKSKQEIAKLLVIELMNCASAIQSIPHSVDYYNQYLGSSSSLLALLLQRNLEEDDEWNKKGKWMDDCLISKFFLADRRIKMGGLMIWGVGGKTEQFCDPFSFKGEISGNNSGFEKYLFHFGDEDKLMMPYDSYRYKRDLWENFNGSWAYIVNEE